MRTIESFLILLTTFLPSKEESSMVIQCMKKKNVTIYIQKFSFVQPVLEQKKSFQITPQCSKFDEKLLISYNTAGICGSAPF